MTLKRLLAGLLLAVVVVGLLLRAVDLDQVLAILGRAKWPLLPLVLTMSCLTIFLKAQRWSLAIASGHGVRPRRRIFAASMIGTAANCVLPARLGDLLRALVLRKHNQVPAARALLSSWGAQLFDLLAVSLLLLAGVAAGQGLAPTHVLALVVGATLVGGVVAAAVARRPQTLMRWAARLPGSLGERASTLLDHSTAGLRFLGEPSVLARIVIYTIAVWTVEITAMWLALYAFNIDTGIAAASLLVAAAGLSFVLPLTPGNIGTFQLVAILVLGSFGVDREQAFAFGVGYQAFALSGTVLLGLLFFQREGLSWQTLRSDPAIDAGDDAAI